MPDPIPQTQKGQLDAFYTALGVPAGNFADAMAAIALFQEATNWQNDQAAIFAALGATDQTTAIAAIAKLKTPPAPVAAAEDPDRATLFALMGVTDYAGATAAVNQWKVTATNYSSLLAIIGAPDQNAAIVAIGTMKQADNNHAALVKALGGTDHASALAAATDIDATVNKKVKQLAASAGLPEPAPKSQGGPVSEPGAETRSVTPRTRLAASINQQIAN